MRIKLKKKLMIGPDVVPNGEVVEIDVEQGKALVHVQHAVETKADVTWPRPAAPAPDAEQKADDSDKVDKSKGNAPENKSKK